MWNQIVEVVALEPELDFVERMLCLF